MPTRSGDDSYTALQHFAGPGSKVKSIWTDNSAELAYAIQYLGWSHTKSTPGISQTNTVAELQVQDVVQDRRTLLLTAGLPACF